MKNMEFKIVRPQLLLFLYLSCGLIFVLAAVGCHSKRGSSSNGGLQNAAAANPVDPVDPADPVGHLPSCVKEISLTSPEVSEVGQAVAVAVDFAGCAVGPISQLLWDFGDGSVVADGDDDGHGYDNNNGHVQTQHVYTTPGTYQIRLYLIVDSLPIALHSEVRIVPVSAPAPIPPLKCDPAALLGCLATHANRPGSCLPELAAYLTCVQKRP